MFSRTRTGLPRPLVPLHVKLYRYLFYGWLFRDARRGSHWERSTALRHNREQARWLPLYMLRWLLLGALLFGGAAGIESSGASAGLAAAFYLLAMFAVPFNLVTALCWAFLRFASRR